MALRTYGRTYNPDGTYQWAVVTTDANGFSDEVYLTTLVQCFKLNLGESPFYSQYGIPAQQSVIQQVFPDFYVNRTQSQFSQYFASLQVSKVANPTPTYNVSAITHQGAKLTAQIPV